MLYTLGPRDLFTEFWEITLTTASCGSKEKTFPNNICLHKNNNLTS